MTRVFILLNHEGKHVWSILAKDNQEANQAILDHFNWLIKTSSDIKNIHPAIRYLLSKEQEDEDKLDAYQISMKTWIKSRKDLFQVQEIIPLTLGMHSSSKT